MLRKLVEPVRIDIECLAEMLVLLEPMTCWLMVCLVVLVVSVRLTVVLVAIGYGRLRLRLGNLAGQCVGLVRFVVGLLLARCVTVSVRLIAVVTEVGVRLVASVEFPW